MVHGEEVYVIKLKAPKQRIVTSSHQRFPSEIGLGLGAIHIILGCVSIILETVGLVITTDRTRIGSGIWCGFVFVLTGVSGILSWKFWYQKRKIATFFVLSIISGTLATVLLILTAVSIAESYTYYNTDSGRRISGNIVVLSVLELVGSVISTIVSGGGIFSCMMDFAVIKKLPPVTRTKLVISTDVAHAPESQMHLYSNVRTNAPPDVLGNSSNCRSARLTFTSNAVADESKLERLQTFVQQAQRLANSSHTARHPVDVASSNDDFSSESYDSESGYDA